MPTDRTRQLSPWIEASVRELEGLGENKSLKSMIFLRDLGIEILEDDCDQSMAVPVPSIVPHLAAPKRAKPDPVFRGLDGHPFTLDGAGLSGVPGSPVAGLP